MVCGKVCLFYDGFFFFVVEVGFVVDDVLWKIG